MTDNDIIRALEICTDTDNIFNCGKCVFVEYKMGHNGCYAEMLPAVFDLINRQKAEIERLKKSQVKEIHIDKEFYEECKYEMKQVKSKTIKEYKEKVKQKLLEKGFYPAVVKNALEEVEEETKKP